MPLQRAAKGRLLAKSLTDHHLARRRVSEGLSRQENRPLNFFLSSAERQQTGRESPTSSLPLVTAHSWSTHIRLWLRTANGFCLSNRRVRKTMLRSLPVAACHAVETSSAIMPRCTNRVICTCVASSV